MFALLVAVVVSIDARKKNRKARCKDVDDCDQDGSPGCCVLKTKTNKKGITKTKGKCSRRPFAVETRGKCLADCECLEGLTCVKEEGRRRGICQDPTVQNDDPATGETKGRRRGGRKGRGKGKGRRRGGKRPGGRRGGRGGKPKQNFTSCSDDKPCPEGFCCVQMPSRSRSTGEKMCLRTKFEVPYKRCMDSCQCNKEKGQYCFTKNSKNPRRGNSGRCMSREMAAELNAPHGKWLGEAPPESAVTEA